MLAPRGDELAVLSEFHDAVIGGSAVTVGDVDVAIGRNNDAARPIQKGGAIAGHSGFAQGHQDLTLRAEFDQHGALAVLRPLIARPDISLTVDIEAVWEVERAAAECPDELAAGIKFLDRRNHGI